MSNLIKSSKNAVKNQQKTKSARNKAANNSNQSSYSSQSLSSRVRTNSGASLSVTNSLGQVTIRSNANNKPKPVLITKSECIIGGVVSGTDSTSADYVKSYSVDPTDSSIFPWLSTEVTGKFEQFRFTKLSFRYEPIVGSQTNGRIGLNFNYDSSESSSGSYTATAGGARTGILNSSNTVVTNVGNSVILTVNCLDFLNSKYLIQDDSASSNVPPTIYCPGIINTLLYGVANSTVFGDLFVDYTVELFVPVLELSRVPIPYNNSLDSFYATVTMSHNAQADLIFNPDRVTGFSPLLAARSTNAVALVGTSHILLPIGTYTIDAAFQWECALSNMYFFQGGFATTGASGTQLFYDTINTYLVGGVFAYTAGQVMNMTRTFTTKETTSLYVRNTVSFTGSPVTNCLSYISITRL